MPNLKTLSLENNLLHDWHQVYLVAIEFPNLTYLSLSSNKVKDTSANLKEGKNKHFLISYSTVNKIILLIALI